MTRQRLYLLVGLVFGLLCVYGAVGSWLGVAQAVGGPRTPGTVVDVHCATVARGGVSCSGTFRSDDGRINDRRMRVEGPTRSEAGPEQATFVPRIANGLDDAIQSDDTAYVGHVSLSIAGAVAIAVVLTVLGVLFCLAYGFIGAAALLRRRRGY